MDMTEEQFIDMCKEVHNTHPHHSTATPHQHHTTSPTVARTYTTPQILTNHRPRRAGAVCTLPTLLPKLDEVVRVRLRVAIRHEDRRVAHVVDGRVKEDRAVARLVRVRVRVRVRAMARVRARGRAMGRVRVTVRVKGRARVRVRFTGGASAFCTPRQYSPMTTRARNMCCTPCALGRE